jgi:FKBP-type peptidyl-prolyl cis-trans isomerase FklB
MDKISYAFGMVIGHNLKSMNVTQLNGDDFARAINDVIAGRKAELSDAEAQQLVNQFLQTQQEEMSKAARADGEAFLADNAKKDDVVVLPSGLQYTVLRAGDGKKPAATDSVKCHYEGTLIDGTVFDSSYQRGQTATFRPDRVIKGWREALTMMHEGSTYELVIPYELGYGERGTQGIPPYSTLIFKVELIKVKN